MDPVSRAQSENSAVTVHNQHRLAPYQFKKGVSGNPNGRPKKASYVTRMYNRVLRKSRNRQEIEAGLLQTLTSKGMAKVLLLREMAERTEGKIAQEQDINLNVTLSLAETVNERRKRLTIDAD